jgi:hypothetical protein
MSMSEKTIVICCGLRVSLSGWPSALGLPPLVTTQLRLASQHDEHHLVEVPTCYLTGAARLSLEERFLDVAQLNSKAVMPANGHD